MSSRMTDSTDPTDYRLLLCSSPPKKKQKTEKAVDYMDVLKDLERAGLLFTTAEAEEDMLHSLKQAKRETLASSEVEVIRFKVSGRFSTWVESDILPIKTKTLYVRKFYSKLFKLIFKTRKSILLGNPGISKSWYHWYVIYRMLNEQDESLFNYLNSNQFPEIIVRQTGEKQVFLLFLRHLKVFRCSCSPGTVLALLEKLPEGSVFYLIEPGSAHSEPEYTGIQTLTTCSPDDRRYKEFGKRGALKFYMPCWKLSELLVVASDICNEIDSLKETSQQNRSIAKNHFKPEYVKARFMQFGGSIRYVLASDQVKLDEYEQDQVQALSIVELKHVFEISSNIEIKDLGKQNISHYVLQYIVDESDLHSFDMTFASEHAKVKLTERLTKLSFEEFHECLRSLQLMMMGARVQRPDLFELVVKWAVPRREIEWSRYSARTSTWTALKWNLSDVETLGIGGEDVKNLCQNKLYTFADQHFPLIDFVFLDASNTLNGIQVTFAERHDKALTVFEKAYARLGISLVQHSLNIYIVIDHRHKQAYQTRSTRQYVVNRIAEEKKKESLYHLVVKQVSFVPVVIDFGKFRVK